MTGFYRALEDKYRGARSEIKSRLAVYLPFVTPLKQIHPDGVALDVGCGRGEWLELLRDNAIRAHGIDLDADMLAPCRALGLDVEQGDALKIIDGFADESFVIVSAFHVAEHLEFGRLLDLVRGAFRVLKPGGLLILETPNSENILVATTGFYLDPTHRHPLPAALLALLGEYNGFHRTKILRLQEPKSNGGETTLFEVLTGVSMDCAIVAQKTAPAEWLGAFDAAFDRNYGVTLDVVAAGFDRRIAAMADKVKAASASAARLDSLAAETAARVAASTDLAGRSSEQIALMRNQVGGRIEELAAQTQAAAELAGAAETAAQRAVAATQALERRLDDAVVQMRAAVETASRAEAVAQSSLALAQQTAQRLDRLLNGRIGARLRRLLAILGRSG